jgi:hypothetical protein
MLMLKKNWGLHKDVVLVLTLYIGLTKGQNFMCAFCKLNG